jgi:hypothetical protein
MRTIAFVGTDYRDLMDIMCEAYENRENGQLPAIEIDGRPCSFEGLSALISSKVGHETPLLPQHEERVNRIFKKRQHGYGRTAHNLYKAHYDSQKTKESYRMRLLLAQREQKEGALKAAMNTLPLQLIQAGRRKIAKYSSPRTGGNS